MLPGRRLGRPKRNDGAALPSAPEPNEALIEWVPEQTDADSRREQHVLQLIRENRPTSTNNAYDGKTKEYYEYCRAIYPDDHFNIVLTDQKVHRFMFYQAMRPKKKRGGRGKPSGCHFDKELYLETMRLYDPFWKSPHKAPDEPDDPVGEATISMYKTVLRNIYKEQTASRVNDRTWDQIWTLPLLNLHNLVKIRRPARDKKNYKEKFENVFAPYEIAEEFPKIEGEMWSKGGETVRSACVWIRHRFCLLFSTTGILRCESLYRAELSDFVGLWTKNASDVHRIYIMILQIAIGK